MDDDKTIVINDGVTGSETPPVTPPEDKPLAGKFKTPEELEKAYLELQKKLGETPPTDTPPKTEDDKETPPAEDTKFVVAGQDVSKFSKMFAETGKLDDTAYEELAQMGFPKEAVDAYIAGQTAPAKIAEDEIKAVKAVAGGDEGYSQLISWAATHLSPEEIATFNKAIDTGDKDIAVMAVEKLQAKYENAKGKPPKLISGKPSDARGVGGFRSTAEVVAAMKDPRYKSDPAYRADVEQRLAVSTVL